MTEAIRTKSKTPTLIGWRERVHLPLFDLQNIEAKIDTGARTTALHASRIRTYDKDGALWVEFHPEHDRLDTDSLCRCVVKEHRPITNTSGIPETRIIIRTSLEIAGQRLAVDISLANRTDMTFPIIIGRTALRRGRLLVDSSRSWITTPQEGNMK